MIGTLLLYGFAFVGVLATVTAAGVLVFTWRLPAATLPGEESPSPAEVIAGHTRGNVRVLPTAPVVATFARGDDEVETCRHCGEPSSHACSLDDFIAHQARLSSGDAS